MALKVLAVGGVRRPKNGAARRSLKSGRREDASRRRRDGAIHIKAPGRQRGAE
jgi:hypothetical protein